MSSTASAPICSHFFPLGATIKSTALMSMASSVIYSHFTRLTLDTDGCAEVGARDPARRVYRSIGCLSNSIRVRKTASLWARARGYDCGAVREESRPISRVLSWAIIPLGPTSPWASSGHPEARAGLALQCGHCDFPLGLAPGGVCHAVRCTTDAVRSYRTLSPLPAPCGASAVCFLSHFPWARAPQALPGTLTAEPDFPPFLVGTAMPGRLSSAHDTASSRPLHLITDSCKAGS